MAKGARSSTVKRNNANLRAKIFGPAVDARTERLNAKLQEIISKPTPNEERAMDVDEQNVIEGNDTGSAAQMANDMEIDTKSKSTKHKSFASRKSSRIEKKTLKKKPRNRVVFPTSAAKQKRISASKKKAV